MKKLLQKFNSLSTYARAVIISLFLLLILKFFSRISIISDFYTDHIFRHISTPLCMICGFAHFSVGEPAIVLAILFALSTLILAVVLTFLRKKEKYRHFAVKWIKSFFAFLIVVGALMTLNCSLPYGCSKLKLNDKTEEDYGFEELFTLRNHLAEKINALSAVQIRDSGGNAVFDDVHGQDLSDGLVKEMKKAMKGISDDYPRLSGYYPYPKGLLGSLFMYQTGTIGVYFPFTMESNYSTYLSLVHMPATICHEYSHLKGYMFEDEANFIAYIACIESENEFVQYSGYLDAFWYVEMDLMNYLIDPEKEAIYEKNAVELDERCDPDLYTYTEEMFEKAEQASEEFEEKTGVSQSEVSEMGDDFTDSYASFYDVELNYSEVTICLLQYFDGVLY